MKNSFVDNMINCLMECVDEKNDTGNAKASLILYSYFQMTYNILTLFHPKLKPTGDRTKIPIWYQNLRNATIHDTKNTILLKTFLFHAHNGFLTALYPDYDMKKTYDMGETLVKINDEYISKFNEWGRDYITCKNVEFENTQDILLNDDIQYQPVDSDGQASFIADDMETWHPLIEPTGFFKNSIGLPIIDINMEETYEKKAYTSKNWHHTRGFSIDKNLPSELIKKMNWTESIKEQVYILLDEFSKLDEEHIRVKIDFFNSSGSIIRLWIFVISMICQKYELSIENEIMTYFVFSCGIFDATIGTWYYKDLTNNPRPINIIRQFLKDQALYCWNIQGKNRINGSEWMSYIPTPSTPEFAAESTVISHTILCIIQWWFKSDNLYDGFHLINVANPSAISKLMPQENKITCLGEFILKDKQTSKQHIFKYKKVSQLCDDIDKTLVISGIHWPISINKSIELADIISKKTIAKLSDIYGIKPIFN